MKDNSKTPPDCQTIVFAVYVIWCRPTNKFYVGVTSKKPYTRIRQHKHGKRQLLDKEIQRIGWDGNWDWWVVEENIPSDQISDREQKWVKFFGSVFPNGYNRTCGGISKIIVTEATRAKISKLARERDLRGERNPNYGKHHTAEVRAAQSARMSGKNSPMYGRPPANKGVPHTEEQKAKISAATKGEKNPFYGKHHTEEAKERNRQAHLGKPVIRGEKHYMYGKHHSEETKAKMREKALAREAAKRAAAQMTP